MLICNEHPSGMCVLGEVTKAEGLDLTRRGVPKSELGSEIIKFLHNCSDQGKACAGIIKSFSYDVVKYVKAHNGFIFHKVRNPLHIVAWRFERKLRAAKYMFRELHGREPETMIERFEGHCAYYASNFYEKFLDRAKHYPIVRIEDLNKSIWTGGMYFKRVMECITATVWPQEYIDHIYKNWTPEQIYLFHPVWENGRIVRVEHEMVGTRGRGREGWEEDPGNAQYWDAWTEEQRAVYFKYFADVQNRLGYNQAYPGSTDAKWQYRRAYKWGTP